MPPIVSCPTCGARNRIQYKQGKRPLCGRCGSVLPVGGGGVVDLDGSGFAGWMAQPGPALVDFWAHWCGPCRSMPPVLNKLAAKYPALRIGKVNTDQSPDIAGRYGIQGIPTLILFTDGKEVQRVVGALPFNQLDGRLAQWLH